MYRFELYFLLLVWCVEPHIHVVLIIHMPFYRNVNVKPLGEKTRALGQMYSPRRKQARQKLKYH